MGNVPTKRRDDFGIEVCYPDKLLRDQAYHYEALLLSKSGLTLGKEIIVEDIPLDFYGLNYIHTITVKDGMPNKPNMVMIHGFGGTGSNFYKMFPALIEKYNVYAPDVIGMGLSSRPQVNFKTGLEYIKFFTDVLDLWRIKMGLDKIYLVGHSLGGYIGGQYVARFPQNCSKGALMSPVGVADYTKGGNVNENFSKSTKFAQKFIKLFWGLHATVQDFYQNALIKCFVRNSMKKGFKIPKDECKLFAKLFFKIMRYPPDLNHSAYRMFMSPMPTALYPLETAYLEVIQDYPNLKIDFYYGENDWTEESGARRCVDVAPSNFRVVKISKSGHQFVHENVAEIVGHLINHYEADVEGKTLQRLPTFISGTLGTDVSSNEKIVEVQMIKTKKDKKLKDKKLKNKDLQMNNINNNNNFPDLYGNFTYGNPIMN